MFWASSATSARRNDQGLALGSADLADALRTTHGFFPYGASYGGRLVLEVHAHGAQLLLRAGDERGPITAATIQHLREQARPTG